MAEKPQFTYALGAAAATIYTSTLIQARAFKKDGKEKGEPKFGATFLLTADSPDIKALKEVAVGALKSKWPGADIKQAGWPWQKGSEVADAAKAKGKDREMLRPFGCILKARSKFEVHLSVLDESGEIIDLETPTAKNNARDQYFFDGVLCSATFNFVPYEQDGKIGVTCYLNRVLSLGKGTRIKIGGTSGAEVFSAYRGRQSSFDPGAGAVNGGSNLDDI